MRTAPEFSVPLQNGGKRYALRVVMFLVASIILVICSGGIGLGGINGQKVDIRIVLVLNLAVIFVSMKLHQIAHAVYVSHVEKVNSRCEPNASRQGSIVSFTFHALFLHGKNLYNASRPSNGGFSKKLEAFYSFIPLVGIVAFIFGLACLLFPLAHATPLLYYASSLVFSMCVILYNTTAFIFYFRVVHNGRFWIFTV